MTTAQDMVHETRRHLQAFQREPRNKLAQPVSPTDETLTFTYDLGNIQAGAHVEIGLELVYVYAVDAGAKTATVQRGELGSVAASHAAGAIATVNPKFPDFAILDALNAELLALSSSGLYAVRSADLTAGAGARGYDLNGVTNLLEILEVRTRIGAAAGYRQWPVLTNYELSQSADTTDFPSGQALFLADAPNAGQPIRVLYKASFGQLSTLADDVEAVARLQASAHDIPPMGAAIRLASPREIKRNFTESQPDSRRAEEVPAGAIQNSTRGLRADYQRRVTEESTRLYQQYPDRGFIPQPTVPVYRAQGGRWR